MTTSPDRLTISIPPDDDITAADIDDAVDSDEWASRSELVREAVKSLLNDR